MVNRRTDKRVARIRLMASISVAVLVLAACGSAGEDGDEPDQQADDSDTSDEVDDSADPQDSVDGAPRYGGELRIAYGREVVTLDIMTHSPAPHPPRRAIFETLYGLDAEQLPAPVLARDHETSDDGMTWTIHLHEGVLFHDGQELTADDVVASWSRYSQVGTNRGDFDMIDEMVAVDQHSVEIHLNRPFPALLFNMSPIGGQMGIMPASVVEALEVSGDSEPEHWIGTGPYRYESHDPDQNWVLTKFEDYWGGPDGEPSGMAGARNAYVDRVVISSIGDTSTRVSALLAGEVDLIDDVPGDQVEFVSEQEGIEVISIEPGLNVYYQFNPTKPPLDDPILREAIRTGLDQHDIMRSYGPEDLWRTKCTTRFMESDWKWIDRCHVYPNDMDRALELVDESSYNGEEIVLMVTPGRTNEFPSVIPFEAYLTSLGLNVRIDTYDLSTFTDLRRDLDAWHIKTAGGGSQGPPAGLSEAGEDRNGDDWPNIPDNWHDLLNEVGQAEGVEATLEVLAEIYEAIDEMNNRVYLGELFVTAGHWDHVQGIDRRDNTLGFLNIWLSE